MPMCIAFSSVAIESTLITTQIDNLQPIKELYVFKINNRNIKNK